MTKKSISILCLLGTIVSTGAQANGTALMPNVGGPTSCEDTLAKELPSLKLKIQQLIELALSARPSGVSAAELRRSVEVALGFYLVEDQFTESVADLVTRGMIVLGPELTLKKWELTGEEQIAEADLVAELIKNRWPTEGGLGVLALKAYVDSQMGYPIADAVFAKITREFMSTGQIILGPGFTLSRPVKR